MIIREVGVYGIDPYYLLTFNFLQILLVCVNRTRFNELFDTIQRITSFSRYTLKKYLFHLIEYGIISYQGENQVYVITRTGLDLLSIINREKKTTQLDSKDIVICLE